MQAERASRAPGDGTTRMVPCAHCGKSVNALRAPRVRFTHTERFYFCSNEHAYAFRIPQASQLPPLSEPEPIPSPALTPPPLGPNPRAKASPHHEPSHLIPSSPPTESLDAMTPAPQTVRAVPLAPATFTPDLGQKPSQDDSVQDAGGEDPFGEAADAQEPKSARASAEVPTIPRALQSAVFHTPEDAPLRPRVALAWAPVLLSLLATGLTLLTESGDVWSPLASTVILALSAFFGLNAVRAWEAADEPARTRVKNRLNQPARRITATAVELVSPDELRAGEEVRVEVGEYFPADGTITSGEGLAELWEGAASAVTVAIGDRVAAGGLLRSGSVQIGCSKTGPDRALVPLVAEGSRLSRAVWPARWGRLLTLHGALLFASLAGCLVWLQGGAYATVLAVFASSWGALSQPIARALPAICCERWLAWALKHGICFAHGRLIDQASHASSAAFCARGTVLHGEPEVAEVHSLRDLSEDEVLSLAAGAESVVHHPVAAAVLRAARTRHLGVDSCRSHNPLRGMGVRCMSSTGDMLVLGSRELLLREKISIALAEETLRGLESRGLTALMLAKNEHLVGVLALQDSLRAGAKAAVQVLLDEGIEPVLISGDSRTTTEAVAHALAIEHVRPEVAASGRAREVQSLIEGGASLAVIGTSPRDDAALGAAPVPIVLQGASISWRDSAQGRERAIGLIGKQVIGASLALLTARRIRIMGVRALLVSLLPPAAAAAGAASLLTPLYAAPIVAAIGALGAARISLSAGGPFEGLTSS